MKAPCPACGGEAAHLVFTAPDFMIGGTADFFVSRCDDCGLLYQNPRISPELLRDHYPDDYAPYKGSEPGLKRETIRYLHHYRGYSHLPVPPNVFWRRGGFGRLKAEELLIPDFVPEGTLLEVGCASGSRLEMLRRLGWKKLSGIEFSESAASIARARGFDIITGKVETALETLEEASLDVVVAGFVLEHVENPFDLIRRIARKLKPGGQLLFSTIRIGAPDFRLYGRFWYNLDLPRHHVFFRDADLHRMLSPDFTVDRMTGIAAPNDYTGSARYRLRQEPRFYDRLLSRARNRILPLCRMLAAINLSSRVAVRAHRRHLP